MDVSHFLMIGSNTGSFLWEVLRALNERKGVVCWMQCRNFSSRGASGGGSDEAGVVDPLCPLPGGEC